ncbi:hypothetical protein GQ607_007344, partial [Colletotrichum asianum]
VPLLHLLVRLACPVCLLRYAAPSHAVRAGRVQVTGGWQARIYSSLQLLLQLQLQLLLLRYCTGCAGALLLHLVSPHTTFNLTSTFLSSTALGSPALRLQHYLGYVQVPTPTVSKVRHTNRLCIPSQLNGNLANKRGVPTEFHPPHLIELRPLPALRISETEAQTSSHDRTPADPKLQSPASSVLVLSPALPPGLHPSTDRMTPCRGARTSINPCAPNHGLIVTLPTSPARRLSLLSPDTETDTQYTAHTAVLTPALYHILWPEVHHVWPFPGAKLSPEPRSPGSHRLPTTYTYSTLCTMQYIAHVLVGRTLLPDFRSRFDFTDTSNMLPLLLLAIFTIPTTWHTFAVA